MNFTYCKYGFVLIGSVFLTGNLLVPANASEAAKNSKSNSKTENREYTFKAPDSKTISRPEQLTEIQGYKVEVYGSAEELLQQVKDVEPAAFIKGNIIQVGIFSEQDNAEDLVRKLAVKGLWARIIVE